MLDWDCKVAQSNFKRRTTLERHKMKSCGRFTLVVLALFIQFIQVSSTANTKKTYYFNLDIESSVDEYFTTMLDSISELSVTNARVTNISIITACMHNSCECMKDYRWSEDVCKMHPQCCLDKRCTVDDPGAMCLHNKRVVFEGSFSIPDGKFEDSSRDFYTKELTSIYSTLDWFDSLNVTSIRSGSINGDFKLIINGRTNMKDFENMTKKVQSDMNATISIVTTGFVQIHAPDQINYGDPVSIKCSTPIDLDSVTWNFKKDAQTNRITNGTEATVIQQSRYSDINISTTSEIWKGIFICDYKSTDFNNIIHRASVNLDVPLLPKIFITSSPQFPNCKENPNKWITIVIKCIIDISKEKYRVTWVSELELEDTETDKNIYSTKMDINCKSKKEEYIITCTFKNRANNTRNATLIIPVIYEHTEVCEKDNEWPEAKINYTVTFQCRPDETGIKFRYCNGSSKKYEPVISQCVDNGIMNLLNWAQKLEKGCGYVQDNAIQLFKSLKVKSETETIGTIQNINASVDVLFTLGNASRIQKSTFNNSILTDFVKSSSNLMNNTLLETWKPKETNYSVAIKYLRTMEGLVQQIDTNMFDIVKEENVELMICNKSAKACTEAFNVSLETEAVSLTKIKNLPSLLPEFMKTRISNDAHILSVIAQNASKIQMEFPVQRLPNHKIYCVYFNFNNSEWSDNGCKWGGSSNPNSCTCYHFSAFTSMMSTEPVKLAYLEEITYTGIGFSILSLVLFLAVEFIVWNTVVKSNISHFRHTVLVNIALCLLIAHCSFLAASFPDSATQWCLALTVLKHFCFLAMFFWMLCMSMGLLHQITFVFVQLRKKVYLTLCFFLGYVCPLLIVICTIITYDNGAADAYYVNGTCWLKYESGLHGSIFSFIIPIGVIVFINIFTVVAVISRLLRPTVSEGKSHDEKEIIRSVIRTVVLLTPTLGLTWIFGFSVLLIDLTRTPFAEIVNYTFTFFNSFQGFFILITACLGEKKVRDAVIMRIRLQHSADTSKSSMMTAAVKTK